MAEHMSQGAAHPVFASGILRGLHLLEADAGTGKTWTLTGLVIRAVVEHGLPVRSILAVTFTTAAVAELKARVRSRLAQMIAALSADPRAAMLDPIVQRTELSSDPPHNNDPFVSEYLERLANDQVLGPSGEILTPAIALNRLRLAMAGVDEMAVLTLHGFCQRLLASQPLSSRAPMGFEPGADGSQMAEPAVRQWWREVLAIRPVEDLWLLSMMSLRVSRLTRAVTLRLADPLARMAGPLPDWRAVLGQAQLFRQRLRSAIDHEADQFVDWYGGGVKGPARLSGKYVRGPRARAHLNTLVQFADADAPAEWPAKAITYFTSEKIREIDGNLELLVRTALVPLCDELSAWYAASLNPCFASLLEEATAYVSARSTEQLLRSRRVSFDDLIRLTHEALSDPGNGMRLAASVRESFPLALVDECQDTDPIQWAILQKIWPAHALDSGCGLVLVGDPKQSIYRFRGADLYAYLEARRSWGGSASAAAPAAGPTLWRLDENQRSDHDLLVQVSSLFVPQASFLIDDIQFSPARLGTKPRGVFEDRRQKSPQPLCWIQWTYNEVIDQRVVAHACALEIHSLLSDPDVRLDGRPLQARDIAVLVGSHAEGRAVKQQLRSLGLAAAETSRDQVMDSLEAWEILRVVAAVADPADTALVRGALATQALGVPLAELDSVSREQLLMFEQARLVWTRLGPSAALAKLFDVFDTATRLAGSDGAERSLTNHTHVLDLLASADEARGSAAAALRWLQRVIEQGRRVEGAAEELELRLESDANLVRILTIHKSKGLEFPVVFVPFAWRGRRQYKNPALPLIRFHSRDQTNGHWQPLIDAGFEASEQAKAALGHEDLAERVRLLYVALTRAQHRCYVVRRAVPEPPDSGSALDYLLSLHADGVAPMGETIDIQTLLDRDGAARNPLPADNRSIGLAQFDRVLFPSWQNTSFTALLATSDNEDRDAAISVRDQDQWVIERVADVQSGVTNSSLKSALVTQPPENIRFQFPAGAQAGTCLHRILEQTRLGDRVPVALIERELLSHGFAEQTGRSQAIADWLDEVLAAPLPGINTPLNRLAEMDRKVELEFQIKLDHLSLAAVVDRIGQSEPIDLQASHRQIRGYLNGFIDLVFRHAGRYYLLDWKSNHLGDDRADYALPGLVDAIRRNGYALQYSVYLLAMHRHLRQRLVGYDPARHLGGIYYLFLRGVGIPDVAKESGTAHKQPGIYYRPADINLVIALDELAGGGAVLERYVA